MGDLFGEHWLKFLFVLLGLLWPLVEKLVARHKDRLEREQEELRRLEEAARPVLQQAEPPAVVEATPVEVPVVTVQPPADPMAELRAGLLARLALLEGRAQALGAAVLLERANRRFHELLSESVPAFAAEVRGAIHAGDASAAIDGVEVLDLIVSEVEEQVRQRRDPELRGMLGDADALADACYQPIIQFARAEGLPLTTAHPATRLSPFDLAIWTGFIPTRVAPIFLPRDFFLGLTTWPALAHEIGHAFFACVDGLQDGLRAELGLVGEAEGTMRLRFDRGISVSDLERVFGGWFEELFCDAFGTMMLGPSYVFTMARLFDAAGSPLDAHRVFLADAGRYDTHPPYALRVWAGCQLLARMQMPEEGRALWSSWSERHRVDGEDFGRLLFPIGQRLLALPFEPFAEISDRIGERLYGGQFESLSGYSLRDVPGLDFGVHAQQQALRARDALLAGQVPRVLDARHVIAGAVLAFRERPELEPLLLQRARAAIPAIGTSEARPGAYQGAEAGVTVLAGAIDVGPEAVREAIILGELLRPRGASRGARRR